MFVKNIYKNYGNSIKILEYKRGVYIEPPFCRKHDKQACQECRQKTTKLTPELSSLIRSKTLITDYILTNKFEIFATFTFDPKKVDSLDIQYAKDKMSKWLNNSKRHSPELKYLIVAEKHKSGRLHFHSLMSNYNGTLINTKKTQKNRKIYNLKNWKYGFSTGIKIDNVEKVGFYMQKYITKDMINIKGKKRFWSSRNLKKPTKLYNIDINGAKLLNPNLVMTFETVNFTIFKTINYPIIENTNITKGLENGNLQINSNKSKRYWNTDRRIRTRGSNRKSRIQKIDHSRTY